MAVNVLALEVKSASIGEKFAGQSSARKIFMAFPPPNSLASINTKLRKRKCKFEYPTYIPRLTTIKKVRTHVCSTM